VDGNGYYVRTASSPKIGRDHKKRNFAWIAAVPLGQSWLALWPGRHGRADRAGRSARSGTTVALLTGKEVTKLAPETPSRSSWRKPVTIKVKGLTGE